MKENFSLNTNIQRNRRIVILKKEEVSTKTTTYAVIPITEEQHDKIKKEKKLLPEIKEALHRDKIIKVKGSISALYIGITSRFKFYTNLVYKFPKRKVDIINRKPDNYRDYTQTKEYQEEMMTYVQWCDTASKSWNTVKTVVGEYCLILKIVEDVI